MEHVTLGKTEAYAEGFRKYWRTIWMTIRHPRELFARIKKNDFNEIYKPFHLYVFTVFLFFLITQLIPYTSTYAPYYAPWIKGENVDLPQKLPLKILLFVMINLVIGLIQVFIMAVIFSRHFFRLLVKLFLFSAAAITLIKILYVTTFPLLVALISPNARTSGIFIHPYWLVAFDVIFYFVLAIYIFLLPKKVPDRSNKLHSQVIQVTRKNAFGSRQYPVYGICLWLVLCLSNFSIDWINSHVFKLLNKPGDTPGVDLTDKNEASKEAIFLTATCVPGDSVDIRGVVMIKMETSGYIPSSSNRKLYFEIEETRERRWVWVSPFLDMDFQIQPSAYGTIEFKPGELYPVTLKALMSSKQFGKFKNRFDKKIANISFQLYLNDTRHCNRRYSRRIIINTDSLQLISSYVIKTN